MHSFLSFHLPFMSWTFRSDGQGLVYVGAGIHGHVPPPDWTGSDHSAVTATCCCLTHNWSVCVAYSIWTCCHGTCCGMRVKVSVSVASLAMANHVERMLRVSVRVAQKRLVPSNSGPSHSAALQELALLICRVGVDLEVLFEGPSSVQLSARHPLGLA